MLQVRTRCGRSPVVSLCGWHAQSEAMGVDAYSHALPDGQGVPPVPQTMEG